MKTLVKLCRHFLTNNRTGNVAADHIGVVAIEAARNKQDCAADYAFAHDAPLCKCDQTNNPAHHAQHDERGDEADYHREENINQEVAEVCHRQPHVGG